MKNKSFFIEGPVGPIEAVFEMPVKPFHRVAVICHPHPLYGGTMNNKVVYTLAKTFQELGIATLIFNFRGVGKSVGYYSSGEGEADDLMAVLDWVKKEYPTHSLWLAGFSFGGYVALKGALRYPLEQLVLVAPAVEHFPLPTLPLPACPLIVAQGEADEVVPPKMVFDWIKTLSPAPTVIRFPKAGHFFHGYLGELKIKLLKVLQNA